MIIEQYTDMAGKIRVLWQSDTTGQTYLFKFTEEPTEQQLQALSEANDTARSVNAVQPLTFSLLDHKAVLIDMIRRVKESPNTTLAQYNNYLGTLTWYEAAIIRTFVFLLAQRLAEKKDVTLANMTENTVFIAVRNFLANTPKWKLARLILGENDID
jgi:hypothetical protein